MFILYVKFMCNLSKSSPTVSGSLMIMSSIFFNITDAHSRAGKIMHMFFNLERYETMYWVHQNHEQKLYHEFFALDILKS